MQNRISGRSRAAAALHGAFPPQTWVAGESCAALLAAIQAGIATVMLPARNRRDIEDVPEKARNRIRFVRLERVDDAIDAALNPAQTHEKEVPRTSHLASIEMQAARFR